MAMIIGVARTTYTEYEQGKIQLPLDKVQKILQALPMLRGELVDVVDDILINDDQITLIQAKNMRKYTMILNEKVVDAFIVENLARE